MTGQIWGGGGLGWHFRCVLSSNHLTTIKAQEGVDSDGVPQGDPWELKLPTTLLKLRDDDSLPIWKKFTSDGKNVWAPGDSQTYKHGHGDLGAR